MSVSKVGCRPKSNSERERTPKAYCQCWSKRSTPRPWRQLSVCSCGEDNDVHEWCWEQPHTSTGASWVMLSEDQKQVTFHPYYSSGTAAVRGDTPMILNHHYYWEVKMLTETYGTDIMVGIGTTNVNISDSEFKFTSLLGQDAESYGLSYQGNVRHNARVMKGVTGFCRGSIIGVRVDLWSGTLEFYLNRESQGICFYNLRRHQALLPMVSSTAAQSSMRLIYAASWKASLLVDAAKILAASVTEERKLRLPPGLWHTMKTHFWLTLPSRCIQNEMEDYFEESKPILNDTHGLGDIMPSQYANEYYMDNVERDYRIVVWE